MSPDQLVLEFNEVIYRSVLAGLSAHQNYPSVKDVFDPKRQELLKLIGAGINNSIALKDIDYQQIYDDHHNNGHYHIKLIDGGLILMQYTFDSNGNLLKHRLCYLPSPVLPAYQEAEELYKKDILYGEILSKKIVKFPIRFDYDPDNYKPRYHPHSHLTLGQYDSCRIPVTSALSPFSFIKFILLNFYNKPYISKLNIFEKRFTKCKYSHDITEQEKDLSYFCV